MQRAHIACPEDAGLGMNGPFAALLGLQGVVFLLWGIQMFRCLFKLRARAVAETGSGYPGPRATLRSFGAFVTAPEYQRDRRILVGLTVLLFALIGVVALTSTSR